MFRKIPARVMQQACPPRPAACTRASQIHLFDTTIDLSTEKSPEGGQLMFSVRAATTPFCCALCKAGGAGRRAQRACEWCCSELEQMSSALREAEQQGAAELLPPGGDEPPATGRPAAGATDADGEPAAAEAAAPVVGPAPALPQEQRLALAQRVVDAKGYDRLSNPGRQQVLDVLLQAAAAGREVQLAR